MTKTIHSAALLLALSACLMPAQADDIYRCGVSYSSTPCPGAILVAADDPRSAAQRAQSEAAARRDARMAQALEKERLRQEAKAAPPIILATARAAPAKATADRVLPQPTLKKPEKMNTASSASMTNLTMTKLPRNASVSACEPLSIAGFSAGAGWS